MTGLRNRIVGLEYHYPADLLDHPSQWRVHPETQLAALQGILDEVGIAGALLAWHSERAGGRLVTWDGHARKKLVPGEKWPVLVTDLDDAEADKMLAVYDPLGALATADADVLEALLATVETEDAALTKLLEDLALEAGIVPELTPAPEAQVSRADELQEIWQVALGDLWVIPSKTGKGEHRLVCGDCTDAEVVARVMGDGGKADFLVTDPPYVLEAASDKAAKADPDSQGLKHFLRVSWQSSRLFLHNHAGVSWFCNWRTIGVIRNAVWARELKNFAPAVWYKGHGSGPGTPWTNDFEMILFYGLSAFDHRYGAGSNVAEIKWPGGIREHHPAEKPVEVYEFAMSPMSIGSGTTFIACERKRRQGRGVEIEPKYCAVTLERLSGMGLDPQRNP